MQKMNLAQFIATNYKNNGTEEHWKKMLPLMFEEDDFEHKGDCVGLPCSCNLCLIERFLSDYEKYIFGSKL